MERVNILGVGVNNLSMEEAVAEIDRLAAGGGAHYVCVSNVHTIMMSQSDPEYRRIQNESTLTVPDGMPLVWAQRRQGYTQERRIYGPDLMLAVCEHTAKTGRKHFFYGGSEGVPERLKAVLTERFPDIQVVGAYSPPFRALTPEEDEEIVAMINDSGADILWVGLGAPKQERWMAEHAGRVKAPVMLGVGAAFPFHTGEVKQAPGWMQARGLEWVFRLTMEPRRLWRRYLWNNPMYLLLLALQLTGLRRYTLDETAPRR